MIKNFWNEFKKMGFLLKLSFMFWGAAILCICAFVLAFIVSLLIAAPGIVILGVLAGASFFHILSYIDRY